MANSERADRTIEVIARKRESADVGTYECGWGLAFVRCNREHLRRKVDAEDASRAVRSKILEPAAGSASKVYDPLVVQRRKQRKDCTLFQRQYWIRRGIVT